MKKKRILKKIPYELSMSYALECQNFGIPQTLYYSEKRIKFHGLI